MRIREVKNNFLILDNSEFIKWLLNIYKIWKEMKIDYLGTSIVASLLRKLKKEIEIFPVKTFSIIFVSLILTKIFFSIKLHEETGLLGWLIRALFLFVGFGGLFCNVNLQDLKKNSFIINYINRHYKF